MNVELPRLFSEDYNEARERFLHAATSSGAELHEILLDAKSPDGNQLSIDIATLGSSTPRRALVHCSGLHGVEGFAGSAIQLALLNQNHEIPPDSALILVHALNPYGMAWLRRFNENNVDLNRNFLSEQATQIEASDSYRRLAPFLNPQTAPSHDLFYLRAAYYIFRFGLQQLTQAIAEGQYEYPRGIFYGGRKLEQGPSLYLSWLKMHFASLDYALVIDVHTGLGKLGQESLFLRSEKSDANRLGQILKRHLIREHTGDDVGYEIRGHHAEAFNMLKHPVEVDFITQEFGTCPAVRVLHALREENRWHHYGDRTLDHPAKQHLKECFAPKSPQWRETIVDRGVSLFEAAKSHAIESVAP